MGNINGHNGELMFSDNVFKCVKDFHMDDGRVAFTKNRDYQLDSRNGNNVIFYNDFGWAHELKPTEFGQHFRIKTD